MRYLDTGRRRKEDTLAYWLETATLVQVAELRLQTGFFSLDGLGLLIPVLTHCKINNLSTNILLGSNDSGTLKRDVEKLIEIVGVPRSGAQLGVVSFRSGYFHPKTYHIRRTDGSQVAFVGSANLTASGLALHVEAGIALDTKEGDDPKILDEIASAIDCWFEEERDGLIVIPNAEFLDFLVENDVLALAPPPQATNQVNSNKQLTSIKKRLQPVVVLPKVADIIALRRQVEITPDMPTNDCSLAQQTDTPPLSLSFTTVDGFPPYIHFALNATEATVGRSALTGIPLPQGAAGLIVQLNRDSGRRFSGGTGTANISIPVASVHTLQFGVYGKHSRPRAQFNLRLRYLSDDVVIDGGAADTNIMGYGFTRTESGHADIRMLVPASVKVLSTAILAAGLAVPTDGDVALLEWPTLAEPCFRLSFLDRNSAISQRTAALFSAAVAQDELVGNGACWLSQRYTPEW